jgi:hypothetical protein
MLSVLAALVFAPVQLTASEATVDISPPELLPLGGYTERHGKIMDPGGDPLYAHALVLRYDEIEYVILSVETLTIPESLVREVKARLRRSETFLLICATHTHCAPDSQMLNDRMTLSIPGVATYKRRWLPWYADKLASAVKKAEDAERTPITSLTAEVWRSDVNRGRRKGADPDKMATLVSGDGHPLFFEYAAHGTFYDADENKTRGDWPGKVKIAPMVLIGPIGDVSPKAPGLDKAPAPQKIAAFWSTLLRDRARSTRHNEFEPDHLEIGAEMLPIPLPKPVAHPDFKPAALGAVMVKRFAPPSASISALRIGKLVIIGVPGEPSSILGRQIVAAGRKMGYSDVLVVSHCNGWMGYILDPKDYDKGGYEATLSFYGRDEGEVVVKTAVQAISELIQGL